MTDRSDTHVGKEEWEQRIKTDIRERRGERGRHDDGETNERETRMLKKGSDSKL